MSIVIVIEILIGILVLAGVVRFVVRDARQRHCEDSSENSDLSATKAPVPDAEPVSQSPDAEPAAPVPDAEPVVQGPHAASDVQDPDAEPAAAQLQPSEAADRA